MPPSDSWRQLPAVPACAAAFAALRTGDFSHWLPLAGCSRRDVEDAFGPGQPFTGLLGPGYRHQPPDLAPMGVHVTYDGDHLTALVLAPHWDADHLTPLGPPDDDSPSGDGFEYHQLTWAAQGLIAHVAHFDRSLWIIVAFEPAPLDAIRTSGIFQLGFHERREP